MLPTRSSTPGPVAGFLLILATLVLAAACGAVTPSPAPASPDPSGPTGPAPSEQPTQAPASESPGGEGVVLDIVDESDVVVVIDDRGGNVTGARSGRAGDGMSVRWFDAVVENVDEDTLRVTWVGLPADAEVQLGVHANGSGYELAFVQPAPPENSDALGFDRVLELDFAAPVKAADVTATFSQA
jgi:hypothetical protein